MPDPSLQDYLEALRKDGAQESTGRFTMDFAARARKMAAQQAQQPGLYVLKFIQAAVAAGAARVAIKLSRDFTELRFSALEAVRSLNLEHLIRGAHTGWQRHLSNCLEAALSTQPLELSLSKWDGEEWSWPQNSSPKAKMELGDLVVRLTPPRESWRQRMFASRPIADTRRDLHVRCTFCPIPVVVDGRIINGLAPEALPVLARTFPVDEYSKNYTWLIENFWLDSGGFCFESPMSRQAAEVRVAGKKLQHQTAVYFPPVSVLREIEGESLPEVEQQSPASVDFSAVVPVCYGSGTRLLLGETISSVQFIPKPGLVNPAITKSLYLGMQFDFQSPRFPALKLQKWVGLSSIPNLLDSYMLYVQDGLLLNPIKVAMPYPGTTAILNRPEAAVDLSFFEVIRDQQVQDDEAWLGPHARFLAERARYAIANPTEGERLNLHLPMRTQWRALLNKS